MQQVAIIDYGSGNLRSAAQAFETVAATLPGQYAISVTGDAAKIAAADRVVLPGQGAFGDCMGALGADSALMDALENAVIRRAVPFFGICVGMQLMADSGSEHGQHKGLGWIPGSVDALAPADKNLKIPHMGWNDLSLHAGGHPVLNGVCTGNHVYFIHSFVFNCAQESHLLASADYGGDVTAIIGRDNLFGTQFHPEKSQKTGLRLIENFLGWTP